MHAQPMFSAAPNTQSTTEIETLSSISTTHIPTPSEATAKLWIAYQLRNGCGYLQAFEVNLHDSNTTVLSNLRKWIVNSGALGGIWSRLMRKFVIETALVDFVRLSATYL
jgi:hypothetical protein